MTALCPCCGYDLAQDEVIERDGIRLEPRGDVLVNGAPVRLTPSERIILSSLMKANGMAISGAALHERMDSRADGNVVEVMVRRVREKLGDACRIENIRGIGYRWVSTAGGSGRVLADGEALQVHAGADRIVSEVHQ